MNPVGVPEAARWVGTHTQVRCRSPQATVWTGALVVWCPDEGLVSLLDIANQIWTSGR